MKKYFYLLLLFFIFSVAGFAQEGSTPMGMKYQAVARDLKGTVLSDQKLTLKITLAGNNNRSWTTYYSETHAVETNQLGLFTLVVGEGVVTDGKFVDVPWSTEDIWMEVAIKENTGFATISNSRLLAVPFAFHAMTASQLVSTTDRNTPGVPANVWSLFGNSNSNPANDVLGTTDNVDMVVITNNIERMRLLANGNINIVRSLGIGANLKVDSSVVLNDKMGSTINNGPFTVARNSPTLLSGTLTVDLATDLNASLNVDGPTDLNSRLNVNNQKPTKLTGTLQVDGVTTLKDTTFVAGGKPTILTGSIRVDSNGTFKQKVILDNPALNQDTATLVPNGALQVAGGGGFGGNLTIAGSARIGGGLTLGSLKVTDTTSSTSTSTGAATVAGGVGIGKQLNVGGTATIGSVLTVNASGEYAAYFNNAADKNGISIKIATASSRNDNNFITFKNANNDVVGRIEGETVTEMKDNNSDYIGENNQYVTDIIFGALDLSFGAYNVVVALSNVLQSVSSSTACVGLGACVTTPIPSWIVGSTAQLVVAIAAEIATAASVGVTASYYVDWKNRRENEIGVTYESGSGDYAEYLMKENPDEKIVAGDIVGVKGGKISKNIIGADRMMVVSYKPIVLGNSPKEGLEKNYEKVAFMGQVPVKVFGAVSLGDYIIPNGVNNGVGIAVSPDKIEAKDIRNIVGIAWSSASEPAQISIINVAVGLNVNDNQKAVDELQDQVNSLKNQIAATNSLLEKLVPGFKVPGNASQPTAQQYAATTPTSNNPANGGPVLVPDESNVIYHELTRDEVLQAIDMAEKQMRESGIDMAKHPFWKNYKSDPSYREALINKVLKKVKDAIAEDKKVNRKRSN